VRLSRRPTDYGLAVLALVLGAVLLLAPATAAKKKLPRASFLLSVNGSQTTTFSKNEPDCVGSGQEEVSFATPQPLKVTAVLVKAEGSKAPSFNFGKVPPNGFGNPTFDVNAVVHRVQTWTATDGCTFASTQSCDATAETGWQLRIFGEFFEENTVVIEDAQTGEDPLEGVCRRPEALGTYFPTLLSFDRVAQQYLVKGPLSEKALFKKKNNELTSNGQGGDQVNFFGESSSTSTSWTVELKRLK
jgi:hypothetical protein